MEQVAALIAAGATVSHSAGEWLLGLAGGHDQIVERLLADSPWTLELAVISEGDEKVLRGRVLHVSDQLNPEPRKYVNNLARVGLGCLPDVSRVDFKTVWAGGIPMRIGDFEIGTTGLLRKYAHSESEVAWNRVRSRYARSLVAATSTTSRLAAGRDLLERTADFLADLADVWCADRGQGRELTRLNGERDRLLADIDQMSPQRASQPIGGSDDQPGGILDNDAIHGIAQGIVHNLAGRLHDSTRYAALAAFAGDTVRKQVTDAAEEPWGLLGLDGPPAVLARLDTMLRQLSAVLAELSLGSTTGRQFSAVARVGPRGGRLARAAKLARSRADAQYQKKIAKLERDAAARGLRIKVRSREDPAASAIEWPPVETAIVVSLDSLAGLDEANSVIAELIADAALPDGAAVTIPERDGAPLPRYAARIFDSGKIFPYAEAATVWLDLLPPSPPLLLTEALVEALGALQELSALAYLDQQRGADQLPQAAAEHAVDRFRRCLAAIEGLPARSL